MYAELFWNIKKGFTCVLPKSSTAWSIPSISQCQRKEWANWAHAQGPARIEWTTENFCEKLIRLNFCCPCYSRFWIFKIRPPYIWASRTNSEWPFFLCRLFTFIESDFAQSLAQNLAPTLVYLISLTFDIIKPTKVLIGHIIYIVYIGFVR